MKIGYVPVCIGVIGGVCTGVVSGVCSVVDSVDWNSVVDIVGVVSIGCDVDVVC